MRLFSPPYFTVVTVFSVDLLQNCTKLWLLRKEQNPSIIARWEYRRIARLLHSPTWVRDRKTWGQHLNSKIISKIVRSSSKSFVRPNFPQISRVSGQRETLPQIQWKIGLKNAHGVLSYVFFFSPSGLPLGTMILKETKAQFKLISHIRFRAFAALLS